MRLSVLELSVSAARLARALLVRSARSRGRLALQPKGVAVNEVSPRVCELRLSQRTEDDAVTAEAHLFFMLITRYIEVKAASTSGRT
jgi:hypothetical protein